MCSIEGDISSPTLESSTSRASLAAKFLFRKLHISSSRSHVEFRFPQAIKPLGHKTNYVSRSMYFVGASKAVLEALTRTWATLLADDAATKGTTVNALLVGATA